MASVTVKQPCFKCHQYTGFVICDGCQQRLCKPDFEKHRKELDIRLDEIGQELNLLHRNLVEENSVHPFLTRIDDWEKTSTTMIHEAAEKARSDFQKYFDHTKSHVETFLNRMTKELQKHRESADYTEIDLKKWDRQLEDLRRLLEKPSSIEYIDNDKAQPIIHLIRVKQPMMMTLSNALLSAKWTQNDVTIAGGQGAGNALNQLNKPHGVYVDDDQTVYIADTNNHRIVAWKPDATSGQVVAGGNGQGNRLNQLNQPTD
ncbi:unnamed protein product, partial [Rotaria sp. Silwood2]